MRIAVFDSKNYDRDYLTRANAGSAHTLDFFEPRLSNDTIGLTAGYDAVCIFVADELGRDAIERLAANGVRLIALRCAGFNNVDLNAAAHCGITVSRVPEYSPHAVAEHAIALTLALSRHIHRAYNRVREGNFSLEGLLGFDLEGKTVGIIGTGRIGSVAARLFQAFGCQVLASDPVQDQQLVATGIDYMPSRQLAEQARIISLHCPLTPQTYHLVDNDFIAATQPGVMIVNTSRGGVLDTKAIIAGLKNGHIGSLGLDVYEEEGDLFFRDLSDQPIHDDLFVRLMTFPHVLITGHQGFFTHEAMIGIARTTIDNIDAFDSGRAVNTVSTQAFHSQPSA